ncbi:hypothetical protein A1Q2_03029 [Trichosporon asahii var. asahii CBS 8904]|uniref:Uncharacterized protein n=1 Tax=Trichosporon asahii var. asahii (strain CBS 8904) TaxID=1220162 RepID=K1W0T2_TRIAC|nr:hypothetical protein A1Q2_03029 [Trichosporon asahii var. asahii CBS 8904]
MHEGYALQRGTHKRRVQRPNARLNNSPALQLELFAASLVVTDTPNNALQAAQAAQAAQDSVGCQLGPRPLGRSGAPSATINTSRSSAAAPQAGSFSGIFGVLRTQQK